MPISAYHNSPAIPIETLWFHISPSLWPTPAVALILFVLAVDQPSEERRCISAVLGRPKRSRRSAGFLVQDGRESLDAFAKTATDDRWSCSLRVPVRGLKIEICSQKGRTFLKGTLFVELQFMKGTCHLSQFMLNPKWQFQPQLVRLVRDAFRMDSVGLVGQLSETYKGWAIRLPASWGYCRVSWCFFSLLLTSKLCGGCPPNFS